MDPVDEEVFGWASVEADDSPDAPPGRLVIRFSGEIDVTAAEPIRSTVAAAFPPAGSSGAGSSGDGAGPPVVFDLSAVEFMDSAGITLLLEFAKQADGVVVRNPSKSAALVIAATGLGDWLPTEPAPTEPAPTEPGTDEA